MNKWVLFLVEHRDRELDSCIAIARVLKTQYDIGSYIVSPRLHFVSLLARLVRYPPPQVVIYPGLFRTQTSLVYNLTSKTSMHLSLNWEQMLHAASQQYRKPRDGAVRNQVHHIAWTGDFKHYLETQGVRSSNIHITGNPAMALLLEALERRTAIRLQLAREYKLDVSRRWVFFPLNYAWAFMTWRDLQFRRENGYPEDILREYPQYSLESIIKFFEFMTELMQLQEFEIIVRPHPSVHPIQYRKLYAKVLKRKWPKSIVLSHRYSIREWIAASDIIGSSWSTAAYDAWRIGKPAFLFIPYTLPSWLKVAWQEQLPRVRNINEFREFQRSYQLRSNADIEEIHRQAIGNISSVIRQLTLQNRPLQESLPRRQVIAVLGEPRAYRMVLRGILLRMPGVEFSKNLSRYCRDKFSPVWVS